MPLGLPNGTWDFNTIFMIPFFAVFALNHSILFWLMTLGVYSEFHISNILFCFLFSLLARERGNCLVFKTVTKVVPQLMLNIGYLCWGQRDVAKANEKTLYHVVVELAENAQLFQVGL